MKAVILNLGAVKKAEIELRPLTVFLGSNGTGKTWAAYAISGVLGKYGHDRYIESYISNKTEYKFNLLESAIEALIEIGSSEINLIDFANVEIENFMNEVAKLAPSWLGKFMASRIVNFENTSIEFKFSQNDLSRIQTKLDTVEISAELSIRLASKSNFIVKVLKEKSSPNLYFYTTVSEGAVDLPSAIKNKEIREFLCEILFDILKKTIAFNTPIFPTERTAFIALPFFPASPAKEQEKKGGISTASVVNGEDNLSIKPLLPWPVQYFLHMIHSSLNKFFEPKEEIQKQPEIEVYAELANLLEREVLYGNINLSRREDKAEVLFSPIAGVNLELGLTSSMTKELASLVLYLRYLAKPNNLVVIDEPEMNLHPFAQLEIAEFLSILSNSQQNLLITTHSPYIVDHIQNLLLAGKNENAGSIENEFFLEDKRAFLAQENVSVYLFEDGKAKSILSEDGVIDWETFGEATRSMSEIRQSIRSLSSNKKDVIID
jgi:predicted ATPase